MSQVLFSPVKHPELRCFSPLVSAFEARTAQLREEMRFYCRLLKWLDIAGQQDKRAALAAYRERLTVLRTERLKNLLERFDPACANTGNEEDWTQLDRQLHRLESTWRLFKSSFHQQFLEFIRISIW